MIHRLAKQAKTTLILILAGMGVVFTLGVASWVLAEEATQTVTILPGPPRDDSGNVDYDALQNDPVLIAPEYLLEGATTDLRVEFQTDKAIPAGGTIRVNLPAGYTTNASCPTVKDTASNNDLNGGGNAIITIASIVCTSTTVQLTTAGGTIAVDSQVAFDIQGVINPSPVASPTNPYYASVQSNDTEGGLLDLKPAPPFYLQPAGSRLISGTLFSDNGAGGGTANDGVQNGTEAGVQGTEVCLSGALGKQCLKSDANGNYQFPTLPSGFYTVNVPPVTSAPYVVANPIRNIEVLLVDRTGISFALRPTTATIQAIVSNIPTGRDVEVFAFETGTPSAGLQARRAVAYNGSAIRTINLPVTAGTWQVQVRPAPSVPDSLLFPSPPLQQAITTSGSTTTLNFQIPNNSFQVIGRVVDGSGQAVSGATVTAYPNNVGASATEVSTTALTDGTFTMNVQGGLYSIRASKEGWQSTGSKSIDVMPDSGNSATDGNASADVFQSGVMVLQSPTQAQLTLKLIQGAQFISGRVLDATGAAISGAHVLAQKVDANGDPIGSPICASADLTGNYIIYVTDGTWELEAFSDGHGEIQSDQVIISGNSVSGKHLQVDVNRNGTVTGTVTKDGSVIAGAFVNIFGPSGRAGAVTGNDGTFSMDVPAGSSYTIDGFLPNGGALSSRTNVTVTGDETLSSQDLTIAATGTIQVQMSGITNGFVEAFSGTGQHNGTGENTSGVYSLEVPAGTYQVEGHHPHFGLIGNSTDVVVSAGQTTQLEFSVKDTNAVTGFVSSDSSVCKNAVSIFFKDENNGRVALALTDGQGSYSIQLADGEYSVGASKPGCSMATAPKTVTVAAADVSSGTNLTMLASDTTISGVVDIAGAMLYLPGKVIAKSSTGDFAVADVDTSVTSGDNYSLSLTAGTWEITARSDGYKSTTQTVTVSQGESVRQNLTVLADANLSITKAQTALLTPSPGGIIKDNNLGTGFELRIPAGALGSGSTSNQISTRKTTAIVSETAAAFVVGGEGYEITPEATCGQKVSDLSSNVTLRLPYLDADVTSIGATESKILMATWSEELNQWEPLATTVDESGNTLTSSVSHFSIFAPIVAPSGSEESSGSGSGGSYFVAPSSDDDEEEAESSDPASEEETGSETEETGSEEDDSSEEVTSQPLVIQEVEPIVVTGIPGSPSSETQDEEEAGAPDPASEEMVESSPSTGSGTNKEESISEIETTDTETIDEDLSSDDETSRDDVDTNGQEDEDEIPLEVEFIEEQIEYTIEVIDAPERILPGDQYTVRVRVQSNASRASTTPVIFQLLNESGELIFSEIESVDLQRAIIFSKTLTISSDAELESYTLLIKTPRETGFTVERVPFEIGTEATEQIGVNWCAWLFLLIITIFWWIAHRDCYDEDQEHK